MKASRLIWTAPIFLVLASDAAYAESSVDARLQHMENTIAALERRVASLEDQLRDRRAQSRIAPSKANKANWRKLQKGMSESDVEELLGSPERVDAYLSFTLWHYKSGGRVQFDGDRRTVTAWYEPK